MKIIGSAGGPDEVAGGGVHGDGEPDVEACRSHRKVAVNQSGRQRLSRPGFEDNGPMYVSRDNDNAPHDLHLIAHISADSGRRDRPCREKRSQDLLPREKPKERLGPGRMSCDPAPDLPFLGVGDGT
jgi:hypothetical protein